MLLEKILQLGRFYNIKVYIFLCVVAQVISFLLIRDLNQYEIVLLVSLIAYFNNILISLFVAMITSPQIMESLKNKIVTAILFISKFLLMFLAFYIARSLSGDKIIIAILNYVFAILILVVSVQRHNN